MVVQASGDAQVSALPPCQRSVRLLLRPQPLFARRGIMQSVSPDAELLTVALAPEATAYSANPSKPKASRASSPNAALVTLLQAHNNARATVAGSLDMFSNELFSASVQDASTKQTYPKSGNNEFCVQVAR